MQRALTACAAALAAYAAFVAAGVAGLGSTAPRASLSGADAGQAGFAALVFTRTAGFRHTSIDAGVAAVGELGAKYGFSVTHTEDAAVFSDQGLRGYSVILFLNTSGDILDAGQQAALERFIRAGGGFVGVHSASDTEYGWPWYGGLVGAYFAGHPAIQPAELHVAQAGHPSTAALPARWERTDEWYNFQAQPGPAVQVLLTIDEASYTGGTMGPAHPISWYHEYDGGRAWYTAMGHTEASYSEPLFRLHLAGGILWAAGAQAGPDLSRIYLPAAGR